MWHIQNNLHYVWLIVMYLKTVKHYRTNIKTICISVRMETFERQESLCYIVASCDLLLSGKSAERNHQSKTDCRGISFLYHPPAHPTRWTMAKMQLLSQPPPLIPCTGPSGVSDHPDNPFLIRIQRELEPQGEFVSWDKVWFSFSLLETTIYLKVSLLQLK